MKNKRSSKKQSKIVVECLDVAGLATAALLAVEDTRGSRFLVSIPVFQKSLCNIVSEKRLGFYRVVSALDMMNTARKRWGIIRW